MEFLSIWQDSLPKIDNENEELFKVDLNQLEGLSLVIKDQIQHFPETKLPNNIQDRLKILFNTKDKWSLDEITPFVKNMTEHLMAVLYTTSNAKKYWYMDTNKSSVL